MDTIAEIREFNRFYTQKLGVLNRRFLDSDYSLTEVRLIYELAQAETTIAKELNQKLGLDAGYTSRTLSRFEKEGLLKRKSADRDRRYQLLSLSAKGKQLYEKLKEKQEKDVEGMLDGLNSYQQKDLVGHLNAVKNIFHERDVTIRSRKPGDLGWVLEKHSEFYHQQQFNFNFEYHCSELISEFSKVDDGKRSRLWMAEVGGERAGSVFLIARSKTTVQLHLYLVDPKFQGMGIGKKLIEECLNHAKSIGFKKVTLYTQSILETARALYERHGFVLVKSGKHKRFGRPLVEEYWEMGF